jgi:deazaflavin-dependent oxidoreductase (nitroreductase family)
VIPQKRPDPHRVPRDHAEQDAHLVVRAKPPWPQFRVYTMRNMQRSIFVLANRAMNVVVRRLRLRRFRGGDLLLLTTTGRKTGQPRTTPLLYLADGNHWVVVASNGGADWEPGWWLNLRAGSPATVEVEGRRTPVTGTELTGSERDRVWPLLNQQVFNYSSYQTKVSRQLAVIALAPAST